MGQAAEHNCLAGPRRVTVRTWWQRLTPAPTVIPSGPTIIPSAPTVIPAKAGIQNSQLQMSPASPLFRERCNKVITTQKTRCPDRKVANRFSKASSHLALSLLAGPGPAGTASWAWLGGPGAPPLPGWCGCRIGALAAGRAEKESTFGATKDPVIPSRALAEGDELAGKAPAALQQNRHLLGWKRPLRWGLETGKGRPPPRGSSLSYNPTDGKVPVSTARCQQNLGWGLGD